MGKSNNKSGNATPRPRFNESTEQPIGNSIDGANSIVKEKKKTIKATNRHSCLVQFYYYDGDKLIVIPIKAGKSVLLPDTEQVRKALKKFNEVINH